MNQSKLQIKYMCQIQVWFRISSTDTKVKKQLLQHGKQYHREVLLNNFQMNGHTVVFDARTQNLGLTQVKLKLVKEFVTRVE